MPPEKTDSLVYKILHNETAFSIQRRLQFAGIEALVVPIRVMKGLFARAKAA